MSIASDEDYTNMCEICGERERNSEFYNPYNDMDLCETCWRQDLDTEREKRNEWYSEHENDEVYQENPDSMEDDVKEYLRKVFKCEVWDEESTTEYARNKPCECGCGLLGGTCEEQTKKYEKEYN
jgi:hypothetical protein